MYSNCVYREGVLLRQDDSSRLGERDHWRGNTGTSSGQDRRTRTWRNFKFIEAKETGRRSTVQLSPGSLANTGVNKITAYKRDQRSDVITRPIETPTTETHCSYCNQTGHGYRSPGATRKIKCPAYGKPCSNCHRVGHFSTLCQSRRFKADRVQHSQQEDQLETALLSIKMLPQMVSIMDSRGKK